MLAICILPICADAQWYLFPGKRKKQAEEAPKQEKVTTPAPALEVNADTTAKTDSVDSLFEILELDDFSPLSTVRIAAILPLKSNTTSANENFLELYSGALLALKDLSTTNLAKMELKVYDSTQNDYQQAFEQSDLVIGPVQYDELSASIDSISNNRRVLVSPLDPKAANLLPSGKLIQAPVPWKEQTDELIAWLKEDMQAGDELIVLRDSVSIQSGEKRDYIMEKLKSNGFFFRTIERIGQLQGSDYGTYRILIASDRDNYQIGAVRSVAIEAVRKPSSRIILYCNSEVRSAIGANNTELHDASAHMTAAYHIDYDSSEVRDFILRYRSLFHNEPSSFAFQGYDIMHYFVSVAQQYGRQWYKKLPEYSHKGLQSDFKFQYSKSDGKVNTAVRRVIYNKDYSIVLAP